MAQISYVSADKLISALRGVGPEKEVAVAISGDGTLVAGRDLKCLDKRFDFVSENFEQIASQPRPQSIRSNATPSTVEPRLQGIGRASGLYTVEINGSARSYPNLKNLLADTVTILGSEVPGFMDRLQSEKARSRRLVSRKREELFDKQHLARDHAIQLENGWWLNTNNSKDQVRRWLNVIARCANLSWNRDIKISF